MDFALGEGGALLGRPGGCGCAGWLPVGGRKAGADWLPHVRVWLVWVGGDVAKRLERVF